MRVFEIFHEINMFFQFSILGVMERHLRHIFICANLDFTRVVLTRVVLTRVVPITIPVLEMPRIPHTILVLVSAST